MIIAPKFIKLLTLYADFAKYRERVPVSQLREVFSSVIHRTSLSVLYNLKKYYLCKKYILDMKNINPFIIKISQSNEYFCDSENELKILLYN